MKKLLSGILSLAMSLTLLVSAVPTAFAEGEGETGETPVASETVDTFGNDSKATLRISGADENDVFTAYKIIDITYDSDNNTVSYDWVASVKNGMTELPSVENFSKANQASKKATLAKIYTKIAASTISVSSYDSGKAEGTPTAVAVWDDELAMGGYLIRPKTTSSVYTMMFKAIQPKVNTSGEYEIEDTFDADAKKTSVSITKTAQDTAAATDTITYTIVADIPKYGADAQLKVFSVSDLLPEGLDLVAGSVSVSGIVTPVAAADESDETPAITPEPIVNTNNSYYTLQNNGTGFTFKVLVGLEQYPNWAAYDQIQVTYDAVLNKNAKIASVTKNTENENEAEANTNTATLRYYTNPYISDDSITPDVVDTTHNLYTYGAQIFKYYKDGNKNKALSGAKFVLCSDADGNTPVTKYFYKYNSEDVWTEANATTELKTTTIGMIYIKGLKEGKYYLKETKAPSGYNLPAEDKRIKEIIIAIGNDFIISNSEDEYAHKGYVYTEVQNNKGFTLPSTGGVGITLIKIVGMLIMSIAIIAVLIAYLRKDKKAAA